MADRKKTAVKQPQAEQEPGFFSDYGYGNGKAIILHDPPQKPKTGKAVKGTKKKQK